MQVSLMGLPIDAYTPASLVEFLIAESLAGRGGYVMTPNLDNLRSLRHSQDLLTRAMRADVRVADGMPLIWASRIQGTPLPARVAGSDLIHQLSYAIADAGLSLFLLGGDPGIAERAESALRGHCGHLRIVGAHCPSHGFETDPVEFETIRSALCDAAPDFVYIGLPFAKAIGLAAELRNFLPNTWFLGLGISLSFVCGDVRRAPMWMQRTGLEWLYRLTQEPHRLGRRYLVEGIPFVVVLLLSSLNARLSAPAGNSPPSAG
jgi:N-acetylglucosaminyldiphosphoundecaprenol N-acetyl-beta-D-mannosaminyltransferase